MPRPPFEILFEDNHLLAINKPAGLATMGVPADVPSVIEEARKYVKQKYNKPGNVYLGIVSRLDAPATGVLLLARTSKAASRLTAQFRQREVTKTYQILVEGMVDPDRGTLEDWVRKDERHRKMHITGEQTPGARRAKLAYETLGEHHRTSLVEVHLETGRKHQIRLQFANCGHPVIGDRKYGAAQKFPDGIALHARRLVVQHPVHREPLELTAAFPNAWREFGLDVE